MMRMSCLSVCSDEDDDDRHVLLYLPISPEIEDVEDSHAAEQQVNGFICRSGQFSWEYKMQ